MIKDFFSRLCGRGDKSRGHSVLIKDYDSGSNGNSGSEVVALRSGAKVGIEQSIARKKEPVDVFTESVDKLVVKLEGINDNLSRQTQQNERLVQKLDELPTLLAPVPDAVNQQRQALFQMAEQLRRKVEQDEALSMLLAKLPDLASRQTESLEAIEERLSAAADVDSKMEGAFERVVESMGKLDAETANQTEWLERMSLTFADNERLIKETLSRQQRRFFWVFGICVGVCLIAIAGLATALFFLQRG
jgi:chromosome segregation ATPase